MPFTKFPSIESFSHVWRDLRRDDHPQPTQYRAKIKLHGTNAGVRVEPDGSVVAQSRNRDLSVTDDQYGFAKWVEANAASFRIDPTIMQGAPSAGVIEQVVYYGEWAGRGIQKKDAVTQLSDRFFFVFAVRINDEMFSDPAFIEALCPDLDNLIVVPDFVVFDHIVDWHAAETANPLVARINELVDYIGKKDPFIRVLFEVDGPGEGLVMTPVGDRLGIHIDEYERLTFKAKTAAHRHKSTAKAASPVMELPAEVTDFVAMFVTEARCEQALEEACGGDAVKQKTSDFLRWLANDIQKEGAVELEELGIEWRIVGPQVAKAASRWFLQRCETV